MTLDYTTSVEVKNYNKEYIDKIIEEFLYMEEVNNMKSVKTTAEEYLFTVNPNSEKMDAEKVDVFHNTMDIV